MTDAELMRIPGDALGKGTNIKVEVVDTEDDLYHDMARVMFNAIVQGNKDGKPPVFIAPVGPVGQYRRLARLCNRESVSCRDVVIISMDEYLDESGQDYIAYENGLSFRRFMDDQFYNLLDPDKAVRMENRIFPDPRNLEAVGRHIERLGGVDICLGGVGIVGHIAFNEPPDPALNMSADEYAALPTRIVDLDIRTRVINSVTAAKGNVEAIPHKAVTVGMKEILASRSIRLYGNREWQPAIMRRWIHGPVTAQVPASLLQRHPDVQLVITPLVARMPVAELR